jgi:hypothetical protein
MPDGRAKNIAGQTFGLLTALEPTSKREHNSVVWRFRCTCGSEVERSGRSVENARRSGGISSCGCTRSQSLIVDLSGERYGRLTVLGQAGRGRQGARWRCRCDCGHEVVVRSKDIRLGSTTSCGCQQRATGKVFRALTPGDRFGFLTVLRDTGDRINQSKVFLCECDCGKQTRVRGSLLTTGQTRSCGCLRSGKTPGASVIAALCDSGRVMA